MNKNSPIAIAVSGGVDSLVSGYILQQRYKNIFGVHFTTGYEKECIDLTSIERQLGFPVSTIDLSDEFEEKVVHYFIHTYLQGKTPNPCLICNREIKFGTLLEHVQNMGADYLATGHYAGVVNQVSVPGQRPGQTSSECYLEKGEDRLKDQSYFLSMLSRTQIEKIIFPLAEMTKRRVKKFAHKKKLKPAAEKESQDICFIHDNDFARFIVEKENITPEPGDIMDSDHKIIGQHQGVHKFTVGQRRGINCPAREPYYVQHIDIKNHLLKVCFKKDLFKNRLQISDIVWNGSKNFQHEKKERVVRDIITKIRYGHKGGLSTLYFNNTGGELIFDEPQHAVTPGQAAVFYKDSRVLGAGIIQ